MSRPSRFPGYVLLAHTASCETCTYPLLEGADVVERDGRTFCSKQCATGDWIPPSTTVAVLGFADSVQEAAAVFAGIDDIERDQDGPTM